MFEQEQEIVAALLADNRNFKRLYDKHCDLKQRVEQGHRGDLDLDDLALERLKKEKLLLKDQMAEIIQGYKRGAS